MPRVYKTLSLDDYLITEDGKVINKHNGRALRGYENGKGYLRVSIGKKLRFVHRLVAEKYVPNPNNYPQVNHKDGNKLNNHANNLEWTTNKQNRAHAVQNGLHMHGDKCPWRKLTKEQVELIRKHSEIPTAEMAKLINISRQTVNDVRKYRPWKC